MRARLGLLLLGGLGGCGETFVLEPGALGDYYFLLTLDSSGQVVSLGEVLPIRPADRRSLHALGEDRTYFVGLSAQALAALDLRFDPAAAPIRIEVGQELDAGPTRERGAWYRRVRPPPDSPLLDARGAPPPDPAPILAQLRLWLPLVVEACSAEDPRSLEPYGTVELLLSTAAPPYSAEAWSHFRDVQGVGDRLLTLSDQAVYYLEERGSLEMLPDPQSIDPSVTQRVVPAPRGAVFRALALRAEAGPNLLVVAGRTSAGAALWELEADGDGVRLASLTSSAGAGELVDVDVAPDGELFTVGSGGLLHQAARDGAVARVEPQPPGAAPLTRVLAGRTHLLVLRDQQVFTRPRAGGAWAAAELGFSAAVVTRSRDGTALWAAGAVDELARFAGGGWERLAIALPRSLAGCADAAPRVRVSALAADETYLYAQPAGCLALLRVTLAGGCATLHVHSRYAEQLAGPAALTLWPENHLRRVALAGESGLLLEAAPLRQ